LSSGSVPWLRRILRRRLAAQIAPANANPSITRR